MILNSGNSPFRRAPVWAGGILLTVIGLAFGTAARSAEAPAGFSSQVLGLERVELWAAPPVDVAQYLAEDEEQAASGLEKALRFAAPVQTALDPVSYGTWETLDDGTRLWRLRILSVGAYSLNLGIQPFVLPEGASLYLYPADRSEYAGPYTAEDNVPGSGFWSPVIPGDELVLEIQVPARAENQVDLLIRQVSHDYRDFAQILENNLRQGWCNNDVICPEGDPWRDEIRSEGVYTLNGSWTCSGQMVNSHNATPPPYFLTAYHCGIVSSNAGTVRVYWNYESPVCGQLGGGSLSQNQQGSVFRARWSTSDFCLIELNQQPNEDFNVYYSGWDARESTSPDECTAIHHPGTDEKAISFNYDPITVTSYLGTSVPGNGSHWRVDDWEDGTTEGGSSGSGIWDENKRLVGQLHGGYASCSSITSDWYGRLSRSWDGGGTSSTQLSYWLDPQGTGGQVLDGRDLADPTSVEEPGMASAAPALTAIRPNPAQGTFQIQFALDRPASVGAEIFDAGGRKVAAQAARSMPAGGSALSMDARDDSGNRLSPGLYFVRLLVDGADAGSQKLILVE